MGRGEGWGLEMGWWGKLGTMHELWVMMMMIIGDIF